ncbi:MAG: putative sulfate exporter family transporter, partial [Hymenobacter sp.]
MSQRSSSSLIPTPSLSAEPVPVASLVEVAHATLVPQAPEGSTGILHPLHTPRVLLGRNFTLRQILFGLLLAFCLTPWASPPVALALGLVLAQTVCNPFAVQTKWLTHKLLQFSVVGLGFGMNAHAAVQAGKEGILFTVVSIFGTLALGFLVGRWLGLGRHVVHLV